MTTTAHAQAAAAPARFWTTWNRGLLLAGVLSAAAFLVAVVGLAVASDRITGAAAWAKPAKFGISIVVYVLTLAWLLHLVEGHRRLVAVLGAVTGVALVAELVLIDLQVIRGTTSHFNNATPFDAAVFGLMGFLVALVFVAAAVAAVLLARQRSLTGPLGTAVRAGLAVALLGMAEAGLMIANRGWQPDGGHTVGAVDGGPGLPFVGWSTAHGDLRVAHFVGLHALQLLPVLAFLVIRYVRRGADVQRDLVRIAAVAYAALVVLLAWQAQRGLPLLRPDAPVLMVALAVAAGCAAAVAVVLRRGVAA